MNCDHRNQELCALAAQVRNPHAPCRVAARTPMFTPSPPRSPPLAVLIKPKGDGRPSPFNVIWDSDSPSQSAVPTIILIVDLLLVVNVTAGSADQRANRRALSAADQRASQRADASARRRAPDCFASRGLGVVIIVSVSITSVIVVVVSITSVIVVVVPGRGITTPVASVLRHRARSGGGG